MACQIFCWKVWSFSDYLRKIVCSACWWFNGQTASNGMWCGSRNFLCREHLSIYFHYLLEVYSSWSYAPIKQKGKANLTKYFRYQEHNLSWEIWRTLFRFVGKSSSTCKTSAWELWCEGGWNICCGVDWRRH